MSSLKTAGEWLHFFLDHLRFIILVTILILVFVGVIMFSNRATPESLFMSALEEEGIGEYAAAREVYQEIETHFPHWEKIGEVYYHLGNLCYFRENDIHGAMNYWSRVLLLDLESPHEFTIRTRLAEIYQNTVGDTEKAVEQWRYLIDRYPQRPEIQQFRLNIVKTHVRTDQFESALIELKNLQTEVQDAHLLDQISLQIGMIYTFQKNYVLAQKIFEDVLASPHCAECRNMAVLHLVDVLEAQENYQKAVEILQQIPDNVLVPESRQSRINSIRKKWREKP
ncbi:MAG: tetratricopeptide repeat protein [Acidobacteria bacterium]|nr:tetratricopeptide repeat protein [Acidobacteriota bacterium]